MISSDQCLQKRTTRT